LKKPWSPALLVAAVVAGLAVLAVRQEKLYALCLTNIEHQFSVYDSATDAPISGALLTVHLYDHFGGTPNDTSVQLVTNDEGRANLLRKDCTYEEVSAPFRKTVVIIFMRWGEIDVEASGHQSLCGVCPADLSRVDKGFFRQEHVHRVEYKIPLVRQN